MTKDKFKDSVGRWRTKSLFYEANDYQIVDALFTLAEEDRVIKNKKLVSLRKVFVELEDPTGYLLSKKYLGGYTHWEAICKSSLKEEIDKWREELEMKLRSIGVQKVIESAKGGNFNASRFLAEKGWEKRVAGRPSSEEIEKITKQEAKLRNEFADDLKRMETLHGEYERLN